MNFYSVQRFRTVGSTVQSDRAVLRTDITTVLRELPSFDHASRPEEENETTVVGITVENGVVTDGLRITRLPDYRQNRVVYDQAAKEYVVVSNGRCVLDHSSPEKFARTHEHVVTTMQTRRECQFAPSEAIALRPLISDAGKVSIAWTYRAVDPCELRGVTAEQEKTVKAQFDAVMGKRRSRTFVGRI